MQILNVKKRLHNPKESGFGRLLGSIWEPLGSPLGVLFAPKTLQRRTIIIMTLSTTSCHNAYTHAQELQKASKSTPRGFQERAITPWKPPLANQAFSITPRGLQETAS